jgi:hypothetical protein
MMFMTTFRAIDTRDDELKLWRGPNIEAIGFSDAKFIRDQKGWFHLVIEGAILTDTGGNNIEGMKLLN